MSSCDTDVNFLDKIFGKDNDVCMSVCLSNSKPYLFHRLRDSL